MHGDDEPYGSVQRVENFDRFPASVQLTDDVGIMNRAATEDVRSPVWPVVSRVLRTGIAPDPRDQQVVDMLDDWVDRDAPRLDADDDTFYDEAGPVIMDAVWRPIANAVMSPVFGPLLADLNNVRNLGGLEGESYVDKDLRTLLGDPVVGPFNLSYCGNGVLSLCSDSLWQAIHDAADPLAAQLGEPDPSLWRKTASRTGFIPGIAPGYVPHDQSPDVPAGNRVRPPGTVRATHRPLSPAALPAPQDEAAGRTPGARGDEHVLDVVDLVARRPADLAHRLGDAVHAVDVGLAEQTAAGVDGQAPAESTGSRWWRSPWPRRARRSRAPRAAQARTA